jgi:hypothetical protein
LTTLRLVVVAYFQTHTWSGRTDGVEFKSREWWSHTRLARDSSHMWVYALLSCLHASIHPSPFPPCGRCRLQGWHGITLVLQDKQTSSADLKGGENHCAERENHMAVTDSQTLRRLRSEESLAEQQGRQALNIAVILKDHPQYGAARLKADALMAKASALRDQIVKIETSAEVD